MADLVLVEKRARHAIVTLNRPEKRNPLPYRPEDGLLPVLDALENDADVRAVVITGAGKAFCSGLDLAAMQEIQKLSAAQNRAASKQVRDFFERLRAFPKPLVAAVNGPAFAGGAGLTVACDLAVISSEASICYSESRIGFVPVIVGVYLERAVGERTARDLLLTARAVPAAEAKELKLVHEVAAPERVLPRAEELAAQFAALSPQSLATTKELLARASGLPLKTALSLAVQANAKSRSSPDCKEGVAAFLEKRKPKWG
ncbi:MAG: enoyl-CoA hydratase/isomerase family protein [Planctomycetota bacterium]|nr:enoyl-CoA hydratase/isomerase family protein [Planctomycetota bacterium]